VEAELRALAVEGEIDRVSRLFEGRGQMAGEAFLILDDEQSHDRSGET